MQKRWPIHGWLFLLIFLVASYFRFDTLVDRVTHCDDNGFLLNGLGSKSALEAADKIARAWTYAPAQFAAGFPLWNGATNMKALTFGARLPSAVAATVGTLFLFALIVLLQGPLSRDWLAGSFTAMLGALSLRAMVESQQGYSYAVTYPLVALQLLAMCLCVSRFSGPTRWLYAMSAGVVVGAFGMFWSYQMLFPTVAAGLTCCLGTWREARQPALQPTRWLRPLAAAAGGIGVFSIASAWLWNAYLGVLVQRGASVPNWARFEMLDWKTLGGPIPYLGAVLKKMVLLCSFLTAPIWPALMNETLQLCWGAAILILALIGCYRGWKSSNHKLQLAAAYGASAMLIMLVANLIGRIPLGVTRHSFVLFVPLLGLILCAELTSSGDPEPTAAARRRKRWTIAAWVGLALFCIRFEDFNLLTRNHFDTAKLEKEAQSRRPIAIVTLDCTWDPRLAQVASKNSAYPCGVVEDGVAALRLLEARTEGGLILLTSHRGDPLKALESELQKHPDWKIERLAAVAPIGSTEPVGLVNGGNGFFLSSVSKAVSLTKGCLGQFGEGWGAREGAADWWRWSARNGSITLVSAVPERIQVKGQITSTTDRNTLHVRVDGQALPDIPLQRSAIIDLNIVLDGTPKELQMTTENMGIQIPPDTRIFGMQARNIQIIGEKSGACELR